MSGYGSDPYSYDLEAALDETIERGRRRKAARETVELANERAFYDSACVPPKGYVPDGEVVTLEPPTRQQLARHRERFNPQGVTFREQRRQHSAAVDDVARVYGLAIGDVEQAILAARAEGLSIPETAGKCGVPVGTVRRVVLARSGRSKTTSKPA